MEDITSETAEVVKPEVSNIYKDNNDQTREIFIDGMI